MKLPRPLRCPSTLDSNRCDLPRLHGSRHRSHYAEHATAYWSTDSTKRQTYETDAPWITWTRQSTDRETRFTGRMRMRLTCCICGKNETIRPRIPRFGPVPEPVGGVHSERLRAKQRHAHPGQRNPADWALPFRNPAAFGGGIPVDMFQRIAETARMEAENDD